jgi:hypothetical protein
MPMVYAQTWQLNAVLYSELSTVKSLPDAAKEQTQPKPYETMN